MSFTSAGSLARNRDFVVAVAARALSLFGDLLTLMTLALLVQSRGEPPALVAALFAAGLLPMVVLSPLVGRLVDTHDSRLLLCVGGIGAALASVGVALLPSTGWLLGLVAVVGAMAGLLSSTWSALIPSIVGLPNVARATGISQAAYAVAMLAAPAVGGLLVGSVGFHVPLLIDAVTFAAIAVAALTIRTRRRPQTHATTTDGATTGGITTGGGWAVVRRDPLLRAAIALMAPFIVLANCLNIVDVYLVRDVLGLSTRWFGVFAAGWGAGAVVGAGVASRLSGERRLAALLLTGCALVAAAAVCLGLARSAAWLVPVALAGGFGNGWTSSAANALIMLRSPEAVRGRIAAAVSGVFNGSELAAYGLGAALTTFLAPRSVLVLIGAVGLVLVAAWIRPLRAAFFPDRPVVVEPAAAPSAKGLAGYRNEAVSAEHLPTPDGRIAGETLTGPTLRR